MAVCCYLLIMLCFSIVRSEVLDHRFFLGQLIEKYGYNGSISHEGFERLYTNLGLGNLSQAENNTAASDDPRTSGQGAGTLSRTGREIDMTDANTDCKAEEELAVLVQQHKEESAPLPHSPALAPACLSTRQLLSVYGLSGAPTLSAVTFLHLCPAVLYQLDLPACLHTGVGSTHQHTHGSIETDDVFFVAVVACLSVVVISISGVFCFLLVPLLTKTFFSRLISFLVALAVGTLLGDAFLHLIPHALESEEADHDRRHTDSILKTGLIFLSVVFFFIFEAVLNTIRNKKENVKVRDNESYIAVNENKDEKEMMAMVDGSPEPLTHTHAHSHAQGSHSNTALMVVMGDGLHNLTDGLAIGAAFSGGMAPGVATAFAVFTHELPHELGDIAVLLQAGVTVRRALLYNLVSSALSLLGVVIGLLVGNFGDSTRWIYAITAGSFIYIALSNLVPEINRQSKRGGWSILLQLCGILFGGALMACIALFEHDIQHWFL